MKAFSLRTSERLATALAAALWISLWLAWTPFLWA